MNTQIELIKKTRLFLLEGIKDLTAAQLNKIPEGYNNNIVWNLGHIIWAQQGICYLRAALPPSIEEQFIIPYKIGTRPENFIYEEEIKIIKHYFILEFDTLYPFHPLKRSTSAGCSFDFEKSVGRKLFVNLV